MPLETPSEPRLEISARELHKLQRISGNGPAKTTKRLAKEERFPKEARVAALIGGGLLVVCATALLVRGFSSRAEGQGSTAPAVTQPQGK
jgi:hypothetical protein